MYMELEQRQDPYLLACIGLAEQLYTLAPSVITVFETEYGNNEGARVSGQGTHHRIYSVGSITLDDCAIPIVIRVPKRDESPHRVFEGDDGFEVMGDALAHQLGTYAQAAIEDLRPPSPLCPVVVRVGRHMYAGIAMEDLTNQGRYTLRPAGENILGDLMDVFKGDTKVGTRFVDPVELPSNFFVERGRKYLEHMVLLKRGTLH